MREIKFRAWNPTKNRMSAPYEPLGNGYLNGTRPTFWPKNMVFMQYTGLRDKNGKEIYEGDILRHYPHWDDGRTISEATMISPWYCGDWSIEPEETEVIGNVWENPELIKP